ncbi:hypothetical protein HDU98_008867 [Podochytrium sp. JEL0797]|nr:hypothetical protein HDU98_008867 [Podochytrium sp. JEL0797]
MPPKSNKSPSRSPTRADSEPTWEPLASPTTSTPDSPTHTRKSTHSHDTSHRILETVFRFYQGSAHGLTEELVSGNGDDKPAAGILEKDADLLQYDMDGLGLVHLAKLYNVPAVSAPKRKIWILLLGNHSAGKSSFINWFIDFPVQKTSVAIETTSFTLITSGKKRETFGGPATCQLFPQLKPIGEGKGVLPALSTEIVPSSARNFDLITFIDSPGLVDGGVKYPFDPERVLIELAGEADLVFSFFDPIGQALCERTMNVVEAVCEKQGHKIFFYLSKADTIPDESDRQKVLIQIAQSLTHRIRDRQFSLDIPPIFIPIPANASIPVRNHINGVLATIDATIAQGVQKSLGALKKDCGRIAKAVKERVEADDAARRFNKRDIGRGCFLLSMAVTPFLLLISVGVFRLLNGLVESKGPEILGVGGELVTSVLFVVDELVREMAWKSIAYTLAASVFAFTLWWFFVKKRQVMSVEERKVVEAHLEVVEVLLPKRHEELYGEYFEAHVSE